MSDQHDIVFTCPQCGASLCAKGGIAGKEANCPKCQTQLVVPESKREGTKQVEGSKARE